MKVLGFSVFFIILMLFMLFRPDQNVSGFASYSFLPDQAKYFAGQAINGSVNLQINTGDEINNETTYSLGIFASETSISPLASQTLTANYILNKTFNLEQREKPTRLFYFNQAGTYSFELLNFSLRHNQAGTYYLKLYDPTQVLVTKQIELTASPDNLIEVEFGVLGEEDVFFDEFVEGETLICGVEFLGTSQLDISIYAPGDALNAPTKLFTNVAVPSSDSSIDCEGNICYVLYEHNELEKGKWYCVAKLGSATKESRRLDMTVKAPLSSGNISDIKVDVNGNLASALDLDEYFSDPQGYDLDYTIVGQRYITVEANDDGTLNITNPQRFEGIETILISAYNGYKRNFSNEVDIVVGTGQVLPASGSSCYPFWDCTAWSNCQNSRQTRSCTDQNTCGIIDGKPIETQSCTSQNVQTGSGSSRPVSQSITVDKEFPVGTFIIIILIIILLGAGGFALYWFVLRKPEGVKAEVKTEAVQTETQETKAVNLDDMKKYADSMLNQGQSDTQIRNDLIKTGWNAKDVNSVLDYLVIKRYIDNKVKNGLDKQKLKDGLIAKGWKKEMIDNIFKELKL